MTERPEAAAIAESEIGVRAQADDPIATVVRTAKLERPAGGCPHGLAYILLDGAHYHHEDGAEEWSFVECALELLPARKGKR